MLTIPRCTTTLVRLFSGSSAARHRSNALVPHKTSRFRLSTVASAASASDLAGKKCRPCEEDGGSLGFMGLCEAMDRQTAEQYLQQLDSWELKQDDCGHLHIQRTWRTKSFVKGLTLCEKIAAIAEAEGHHPDLHLTDWNKLTVSIWTHARNGLTENDFILAAKLEAINKEGLLRGKKKRFADV